MYEILLQLRWEVQVIDDALIILRGTVKSKSFSL